MQYTAGSFASIITGWFGWILRPERHAQLPEGPFPAHASRTNQPSSSPRVCRQRRDARWSASPPARGLRRTSSTGRGPRRACAGVVRRIPVISWLGTLLPLVVWVLLAAPAGIIQRISRGSPAVRTAAATLLDLRLAEGHRARTRSRHASPDPRPPGSRCSARRSRCPGPAHPAWRFAAPCCSVLRGARPLPWRWRRWHRFRVRRHGAARR